MTSKPTLLYVINHIDWFWSHRLPLAQGALDAGYDVSVAVPDATSDPKLQEAGFGAVDLEGGLIGTILHLRRILKQRKPDLVHAITIKYAFIAGLASLGLKGVRVVHTIAGLGYLFSGSDVKSQILRVLIQPFLRLALRRKSIELIFQNPDDMEIMVADRLADPARSHLIRGSGVDVTAFTPRTDVLDADLPIVVMPTRLVHDKGVAVFVEAARILQKRGVKVQMQIAGGVSASNPLAISTEEMEAMVTDGAATWLGQVSDMPDLLAQASLVAYPSHYREGIPKVLLEACAMGKAIITTDHPGCREAVRDGYNGLLVPVKSARCLAEGIERLLADPDLRAQMGQHSRQRAEDEFAAELIVAQTLAVYDVFS